MHKPPLLTRGAAPVRVSLQTGREELVVVGHRIRVGIATVKLCLPDWPIVGL